LVGAEFKRRALVSGIELADQGRQRRYHNSLSYWLQGRTEPAVRSALPG
jgi:hypothetical protein